MLIVDTPDVKEEGSGTAPLLSSRERGFALVELLVVMLIVSILGGVILFTAVDVTHPVTHHGCANEARQFEQAVAAYEERHHNLPQPLPHTEGNGRGVALVLEREGLIQNPVLRYYGVATGQWIYLTRPGTVVREPGCG